MIAPNLPSISPGPPQLVPESPNPLLRIQTDPHAGRTYHATAAIPPETIILEASTPYACTIWKQFRNEVCAECWRYEGGRRTFLTRKDDDGYAGVADLCLQFASISTDATSQQNRGAGLWFCHERCQASWIMREGTDALALLRHLEDARRKKERVESQGDTTAEGKLAPKLTEDSIQRAWDEVRRKESIPKEIRRWKQMQLDDYETDMARYVLLALVHLRRKQPLQTDSLRIPVLNTDNNVHIDFGGATWSAFASLQSNELQLLRTYPEFLEKQIRVYQALRGRFGVGSGPRGAGTANSRCHSEAGQISREPLAEGETELQSIEGAITIASVRTALSVDPGNSFGIWEMPMTEESECLGFAVYPTQSLFNHHCSPNVSKGRDGRALRFVTTKAVSTGEELCISYGYMEGMGWRARRKELQEGWFFVCRCSRCLAEAAE